MSSNSNAGASPASAALFGTGASPASPALFGTGASPASPALFGTGASPASPRWLGANASPTSRDSSSELVEEWLQSAGRCEDANYASKMIAMFEEGYRDTTITESVLPNMM